MARAVDHDSVLFAENLARLSPGQGRVLAAMAEASPVEPYSAAFARRPGWPAAARSVRPSSPCSKRGRGRARRAGWRSLTPSSRPGCAVTDLPELIVADAAGWRRWLAEHHADSVRRLAGAGQEGHRPSRPASPTTRPWTKRSVTAGSTARSAERDEATYFQRFTPRTPPQRLVEVATPDHRRTADRRRPHAAGRPGRGRGRPGRRSLGRRLRRPGHHRGAGRPRRGPVGQPPGARPCSTILTSQNRFAILYRLNAGQATRHPLPAHPRLRDHAGPGRDHPSPDAPASTEAG